MVEHLHHHPDGLAIPDGFTIEDLDWTAISWDIRREQPSGVASFIQYIVAPGALLVRSGVESAGSFRTRPKNPPTDVLMSFQPDRKMSNLGVAMGNTFSEMSSGFEWAMKPFTFTINRRNFPTWEREHAYISAHTGRPTSFPVNTLGDTLRWGGPVELKDVFNESFFHRRKILEQAKRKARR